MLDDIASGFPSSPQGRGIRFLNGDDQPALGPGEGINRFFACISKKRDPRN
jgi:hypothetical protein